MKKFLSIVAVLALVLSLSAVAFAAAESPVGPTAGTSEDGSVVITPSEVAYDADPNAEVVDVQVIGDDGQPVTGPVTVAFTYDKAGQVTGVFVQNADGSWDNAEFTAEGDTLTVNFPHLSPVAFVLGAEVQPGGNGGTNGGATTDGTGTKAAAAAGAKTSPKTGYNTAVWALSAAAMAIAAGYLFSRKKVTE